MKPLIEEHVEQVLFAWSNGDLSVADVAKEIRQGMIPEREAVRIPPVSEWPEFACEVKTFFIDQHGRAAGGDLCISTIRRCQSAWVPKVGSSVFYRHTGNSVGVGVIESIKGYDKTAYYMQGNRDTGWYEVKPFDASKIGKPWEEI